MAGMGRRVTAVGLAGILVLSACAPLRPERTGSTANDLVSIVASETGVNVTYDRDGGLSRMGQAAALSPLAELEISNAHGEDGQGQRIDLRPDPQRSDGFYPTLSRLGQGWLIYLPPFVGEASEEDLTVTFPAGWIALPDRVAQWKDGFLYVGPASYLRDGVVSDPAVPAAVRDALASGVRGAASYFSDRLGGTASPAMYSLGLLPMGDGRRFAADVSANEVVNFQVAADLGGQEIPQLELLAAHETFHVFARKFLQEASAPGWVREGAAEYAALSYLEGRVPDEARRIRERHLNACLRSRRLEAGLPDDGAFPERYSCGTTLVWLADLGVKQASSGRATLFDHWRLQGGTDGWWRHPLCCDAAQASLVDLAVGRYASNDRVIAAMTSFGVVTNVREPRPTDWGLTVAAALAYGACRSVDGVSLEEDGRWVVQSAVGCGGSGAFPTLTHVNGLKFDADPQAAFKSAEQDCEAGQTTEATFSGSGGEFVAQTRCAGPMSPPQPYYEISLHSTPLQK